MDSNTKPIGINGVDFFSDVMGSSQAVPSADGPLQEPPFMKQISRHARRDSGHLLNRTSTDNQVW